MIWILPPSDIYLLEVDLHFFRGRSSKARLQTVGVEGHLNWY